MKEMTGFIHKGKALVFATAGGEPLNNDTVSRLLDEFRITRTQATAAEDSALAEIASSRKAGKLETFTSKL